jgi:glycosyltransferase involved in cell wall biosynthesis
MRLKVLSVAYPFAPVSADPVGGAEQVLARLDRALVEMGAESLVLAAEGSTPRGRLIPAPRAQGDLEPGVRDRVQDAVRERLEVAIRTHGPDVVHLHGLDFASYLPAEGPPVLVTLHLPLSWYPPSALRPRRPDTWLAPVSADQARRAPPGAVLLPPVENGVDTESFAPRRKRGYVVALGRICPEKGFHLALDAAKAASSPLLLAGSAFPYPEHRRYLDEEIRPRLDRAHRWIGPVAGRAKRRLLAAADCLIAPSLVPETSSLAAREALAAGTPVVALRTGALAETVTDGRTGVLADAPSALPEAIRAARRLEPETCRAEAQRRFSARGMIAQYLEIYRRLADGGGLRWA